MRFPDTAHVLGGAPFAMSISQEKLVLRCFGAITIPHRTLCEPNYAIVVVALSVTFFCGTPHPANAPKGLARESFLPDQPRKLTVGGISARFLGKDPGVQAQGSRPDGSHEQLDRIHKVNLRQVGWAKAAERVKAVLRDGRSFDSATWLR
jgi:hypothetical protein